jgi:hypothetical protein
LTGEGFWVELRPLGTARIESRSLIGLLNVLYNSGKPFRFYMANCESTVVEGRRAVRFFLELSERNVGEHAARIVEATLDVEAVEAEPPRTIYERCLELELSKHYALPLCLLEGKVDLNPVDVIVEALSGGTGAFEVFARGDPGARLGIHKYIYSKIGGKASFSKTVSDIFFGALAEATVQRDSKDISREAWWRYSRQRKEDLIIRKELKAIEEKLNMNLFTCEFKIYGSRDDVEAVMAALPSAMNMFRRFKASGRVEAPMKLLKPSRHSLRNAFRNFWKVAPAAILAMAYHFDLFNPLRLGWVDLSVAALAVVSIFSLLPFLRKRNPIVLSAEEISLIIGLPSSVGKLPIEHGGPPFSRKSLAKNLCYEEGSQP